MVWGVGDGRSEKCKGWGEEPGFVGEKKHGERREEKGICAWGNKLHGGARSVSVALLGDPVQDLLPLRRGGWCLGDGGLQEGQVGVVVPDCWLLRHLDLEARRFLSLWVLDEKWLNVKEMVVVSEAEGGERTWGWCFGCFRGFATCKV